MDFDVAFDKLSQLADAHDVAAFLTDQQAYGYRGSAVNCPVARWLERETGLHVAVTDRLIQARDPFDEGDHPEDVAARWDARGDGGMEDWGPWPERWTYETPDAVRGFVLAFDEGEAFGALVDNGPGERHRCRHGMGW